VYSHLYNVDKFETLFHVQLVNIRVSNLSTLHITENHKTRFEIVCFKLGKDRHIPLFTSVTEFTYFPQNMYSKVILIYIQVSEMAEYLQSNFIPDTKTPTILTVTSISLFTLLSSPFYTPRELTLTEWIDGNLWIQSPDGN
jgi:hypothetical protein